MGGAVRPERFSCATPSARWCRLLLEAVVLVVLVVILFLADLARVDYPIDRRAGIGGGIPSAFSICWASR